MKKSLPRGTVRSELCRAVRNLCYVQASRCRVRKETLIPTKRCSPVECAGPQEEPVCPDSIRPIEVGTTTCLDLIREVLGEQFDQITVKQHEDATEFKGVFDASDRSITLNNPESTCVLDLAVAVHEAFHARRCLAGCWIYSTAAAWTFFVWRSVPVWHEEQQIHNLTVPFLMARLSGQVREDVRAHCQAGLDVANPFSLETRLKGTAENERLESIYRH